MNDQSGQQLGKEISTLRRHCFPAGRDSLDMLNRGGSDQAAQLVRPGIQCRRGLIESMHVLKFRIAASLLEDQFFEQQLMQQADS